MLQDLVEIREATEADVDSVANIHIKMWQFAYQAILPNHFLQSLSLEQRKKFRKRLLEDKKPNVSHYVAIYKRKVVGFCDFGPGTDDDSPHTNGQIYALYVDPAIMRKRVGERLREEAEDKLRQIGFKTATLWLIEKNIVGRSFYEKHGWQFDGTVRTETRHNITYDVVRYKKLL